MVFCCRNQWDRYLVDELFSYLKADERFWDEWAKDALEDEEFSTLAEAVVIKYLMEKAGFDEKQAYAAYRLVLTEEVMEPLAELIRKEYGEEEEDEDW